MKIFISWSGEESKQIALLLKPWLKKLIQTSEPWMSDLDIEPGSRWSETISTELRASDFGIICVTPHNKSAEWINFEAGALSIAMRDTDRKVVPLLIGFDDRGGLQGGPLALFNAVRFNEDDVWKLLLTLNAELPVALDGNDLRELFDVFWPRLAADVEKVTAELSDGPAPAPKSHLEISQEILETVLEIQKRQRSDARPSEKSLSLAQIIAERDQSEYEHLIPRHGYHLPPVSSHLTAREEDIFELMRLGLSPRDIAVKLAVSVRTVEGHVYRILSKLGVEDPSSLFPGDEPSTSR